jgi:hypothetical protein
MRTWQRKAVLVGLAVLGSVAALTTTATALAAARDGAAPAGSVTFLAGEASRSSAGEREKLALGSLVYENDLIETAARTRLEIRLQDQSALRIGPLSKLQLVSAVFGKGPEDRKVNAKLAVGKVWAQVAHAVGGGAKFEVQTENAVAGVRGTTFRVDARHDRSCVVKVYAGAVAVAGNHLPRPEHRKAGPREEGGPAGQGEPEPAPEKEAKPVKPGKRVQVAGPQQVTREQWERRVEAMMLVRVSADGQPSAVESFALAAAGADDWEEWNRERDTR